MQIKPLAIEDVKLITPRVISDDRGFFTRLFCTQTLAKSGIDFQIVQMNLSGNRHAHTLRGLHYQLAPSAEAKLVRCSKGRVLDIAVDARPDSPTYLKYVTAELSADAKNALYVPPMFAHGYFTLTEDAELAYATSSPYTPELERGMRYDDPAIGLELPHAVAVMSEKDKKWPMLDAPAVSR